MKAVVIGGGVAGVAAGVQLHHAGWDVVICEREANIPRKGNAFLMHSEGKRAVEQLVDISGLDMAELPGHPISQYTLYDEHDKVINELQMDTWQCLERPAFMEFLYRMIPVGHILHNKSFSHFIYNGSSVVAAAFTDGTTMEGDLFIGADGARSLVREALFGPTTFTQVQVKEIIGKATGVHIPPAKLHHFIKRQHTKEKVSFGAIPTGHDSLIWFMQFEASRHPERESTPESLKEVATQIGNLFPEEVRSLIAANDFSLSYLWNTTDFDLLPHFHKGNVVLIGDSAHLSLPFTSAGTTNALLDAQTLAQCIDNAGTVDKALRNFYSLRSSIVSNHTALGRKLKDVFLDHTQSSGDTTIPLISSTRSFNRLAPKHALISIIYVTDPICSTCWIVQPQLKKLHLEYGKYLEFEYRMGGLLPSWVNFQRGPISTPADAAVHWKEIEVDRNQMPILSDIWNNDPLSSSYPPSIAFKAAQLQSETLALEFLRQMREHLFIDNVNIERESYLIDLARKIGLNAERFAHDLKHDAVVAFEQDLALSRELGIELFPTFLISTAEKFVKLEGYQEYDHFVQCLLEVSGKKKLQPTAYPKDDPVWLLSQCKRLTSKELSFLMEETMEQAESRLAVLHAQGIIVPINPKVDRPLWRLVRQ